MDGRQDQRDDAHEELEVRLRPLTRADLPRVSGWLRQPRVARWWDEDPDPVVVERRYGPSVDGTDPTEVFVVRAGGRDVGLVQRYRLDDEPSYLAELRAVVPVPPGALSVDYLVADDFQGRGLGPAAIAALVADSWHRHPDAGEVLVPVAAGNRASRRALEKAGFHLLAEVELEPDNPVDPRDHVVYRVRRPGRLSPRNPR